MAQRRIASFAKALETARSWDIPPERAAQFNDLVEGMTRQIEMEARRVLFIADGLYRVTHEEITHLLKEFDTVEPVGLDEWLRRCEYSDRASVFGKRLLSGGLSALA